MTKWFCRDRSEGPLAAHIGSFASGRASRDMRGTRCHRQVLLAACFSRWLGQNGVRLRSVSIRASQHGICSIALDGCGLHRGDAAALRHLIEFLRREGVIPAEKVPTPRPTPVERCAQAFEHYLRDERALGHVRRSSTTCRSSAVSSRIVSAMDQSGSRACVPAMSCRFVQRQAPRLHLKRAKLLTTALRSFLQYARYRGEVTLDLAAAVPVVANWSMTSIPARLRRIRSVSCWPVSIDAPRSGVAITPSCSCSHDWGCVQAKWPFSNSMTLTGTQDS